MNIERLKEFITLASCLNYSKAANQLYLTQPALSRHIHDLENSLGVTLFIRDTHNVHLTSIGEIFYGEARAVVERYEQALLLIRQAKSDTAGTLHLGFLGTASQGFLAEFVVEFTASHPEIKLELTCGNMNELMTQLMEDQFDVSIITHFSRDYHPDLESEKIDTYRLYAIMHPMHPLASRETMMLADLDGFPYVNFSEQNHMARVFNQMLLKKAGTRNVETANFDTVEEGIFMASINRGFYIIPEYLLSLVPESLAMVPLMDDYCTITLNLIWKKNNTNGALPVFVKEFRSFMKNHFAVRRQP